jgi:hypothetical protein
MVVNFNNPKNPAITKVTVKKVVDNKEKSKVIAHVKEFTGKITLWEGDTYTSIGQWTDTDVENRLLEIYNNNQVSE